MGCRPSQPPKRPTPSSIKPSFIPLANISMLLVHYLLPKLEMIWLTCERHPVVFSLYALEHITAQIYKNIGISLFWDFKCKFISTNPRKYYGRTVVIRRWGFLAEGASAWRWVLLRCAILDSSLIGRKLDPV